MPSNSKELEHFRARYRDVPISEVILVIDRLENCNCRSCVKNARKVIMRAPNE